jgi:hypothetical protein
MFARLDSSDGLCVRILREVAAETPVVEALEKKSHLNGSHSHRSARRRAMFLSAFAALRDPVSRAYYTRKISQGKRHNQAHSSPTTVRGWARSTASE